MSNQEYTSDNPIGRFRLIDEVRAPVTRWTRIKRTLASASERIRSRGKAITRISTNQLGLIWAREPAPPAIWFLTVVTVGYLLIELAFSAWLVDILGSYTDDEVIHRAEHYGRLISGFAVALLFWPLILKGRGLIARAFKLGILTTVIMAVVYHGERDLINNLVESSSPEARSAAVTGSILRTGLATGQVKNGMLEGMWTDEIAASSAGRAFVGISAFLAAGSDSARKQTMAIAPELIRGAIDTRIGIDAEYDRYAASQRTIRSKYAQYQEGIKTYRNAVANADGAAAKAWEDYLDALEARHRYWGRWLIKHPMNDGELAPQKARKSIREAVRKKGIPVLDTWNTGDRATFIRLAKDAHIIRAQSQLERKLKGMPQDLDLADFAATKQVQSEWRASLQYPTNIGTLPISKLSKAQFKSQIYDRLLDARTKTSVASLKGDASQYADDGKKAEEGRAAFEAMIAPVFALTLSLIGAIVHLCKVSFLGIHIIAGVRFRHAAIKTLVIFSIVIGVFAVASYRIQTPLTSHSTYQTWTSMSAQVDFSSLESVQIASSGWAMDAMIKTQSAMYPAFNVIRIAFEPIVDTEVGQGVMGLIGVHNAVK